MFMATLTGSAASGVDYSKVSRAITKEPVYQSKTPKYALLLFGREAKLRIWLVLDGETIYLDRNGDGDLTGDGERLEKRIEGMKTEIADTDGKTRYLVTHIGVYPEKDRAQARLDVNVEIKGPVEYRQYCDLELRDSPSKAAVAHFHGPLTIGPRKINWKLPPQLKLKTGDAPADLPAIIGTMDAEHGCWVVVCSHNGDQSAFPPGVRPVVDIEFPPKTLGKPPVKERFELDKFC
jgi:hypothetical protein